MILIFLYRLFLLIELSFAINNANANFNSTSSGVQYVPPQAKKALKKPSIVSSLVF